MIIGRFLMRFLLVPLGGCVAICVAMVFVMFAHWNRIAAPNADDYGGLATIFRHESDAGGGIGRHAAGRRRLAR